MIRIITGSLRGRKLEVPPEKTTRPTTDRVRESIFNLLENHMAAQDISFSDITVLDAFAGSGALGFEALSRGAQHVTFFDPAPPALKVLQHNAACLKCDRSQVRIKRVDATKPPKVKTPVGLVFMDPPYNKGFLKHAYDALMRNGWVDDSTIFIFEMSDQEELNVSFDDKIKIQRTYGSTTVTLL